MANNDLLMVHMKRSSIRHELQGESYDPLEEKIKKSKHKLHKKIESKTTTTDTAVLLLQKKQTGVAFTNTPSATAENSTPPSWLLHSSEAEKKKKDNKKKKQKKKRKKALNGLSDTLLDANSKTGNLLAELIKHTGELILVNDEIWSYYDEDGCFHKCSYTDIAQNLRDTLPYEDQLKIASRDYKESYEQLRISGELVHEEGFFENQPYVNCLNGVVDVLNGTLLEHSSEYVFKHCINAQYLPNSKCPTFLEYVDCITDNNKDMKHLLRVIMGYIFSHYNNAKKAVLIYGIPHTGKSVLCNVIERIVGKDYTSHVDLCMLQKQEYAAVLSGKLLNIAPDLKNEALKDVGFFKSLLSHDDKISARALYSNPQDVKCETKMLFSSNHLLTFDSSLDVFDIEAVFNRLIYFPYLNRPISDKEDNKHLSDDIFKERDAIFTWAIKGLKDYVENNECFPEAKPSSKIKTKNMAKYCPEKIFFEKYIKKEDGVYESSSAIKTAFEQFCLECEVRNKGNINTFLDEHEKIPKKKKRIDESGYTTSIGNPIYVYEGIRLRKPFNN